MTKYHTKVTPRKYETYALVAGSDVENLLQMLQYDACHPRWESQTSSFFRRVADGKRGLLIVRRFEADPRWSFTPDRWRSFGFTCVPITEHEANEIHHGRYFIREEFNGELKW